MAVKAGQPQVQCDTQVTTKTTTYVTTATADWKTGLQYQVQRVDKYNKRICSAPDTCWCPGGMRSLSLIILIGGLLL